MRTVLPGTSCPSEQTLEAFTRGVLAPNFRRSVALHMTNCENCRMLHMALSQSMSVDVVERRGFIRRPVAIALGTIFLIAVAVVVMFLKGRGGEPMAPATVMNALVEATRRLDHRPTEARLMGGFEYKPAPPVKRAANANPPSETRLWRVMAVAATAIEQVAEHPSVPNLHAVGVSYLLLGNDEQAVESLVKALQQETGEGDASAAIHSSRNAALLNDLSAALYTRGIHSDRPSDFFLAFDAAERAGRSQMTSESAWNRALALEALHLDADARERWQDFIRLDGSSSWAAEARKRLNKQNVTVSSLWEEARPSLQRAAAQGDQEAVTRIVAQFPHAARMWAEHSVLPQWAETYGQKGASAADAHLKICRTVGEALAKHGGERMLADTVSEIDEHRSNADQLGRYAAALRAYAKGRRYYAEHRVTQASEAFEEAAIALEGVRSSFSLAARMYALSSSHYQNRFDEVSTGTTAMLTTVPCSRYPSLCAHLYWLRALAALNAGSTTDTIADYSQALRIFTQLGEEENILTMHQSLAEALSHIGDEDAALRHRLLALELAEQRGAWAPRRLVMLISMAKAALAFRAVDLALLCLNRQIEESSNPLYADLRANALLWRSRIHESLGDRQAAARDLDAGWRSAEIIADGDVREYAKSTVEFVRQLADAQDGLPAKLAVIDRGIEFAQRTRQHSRLSQLYELRGLQLLRSGAVDAAEEAFLLGIESLENQRGILSDEEQRDYFFETGAGIFEHLMKLYLTRGDRNRAFLVAERSRARSLLERLSGKAISRPVDAETVKRRLPAHLAVVEYEVLDDRLVTWVITASKIQLHEKRLPRSALTRLVSALQAGVVAQNDGETPDGAAALFDVLVRPWISRIEAESAIAIIPDEALLEVPFNALYNRSSGAYVLSKRAVTVTPSAAILLKSAGACHNSASRSESALLVAPSTDESLPALRAASDEIDRIARLYGSAIVLRGSTATKSKFMHHASTTTMIHFAGHGLSGMRASRPRLMFAEADSPLYAEDIVKLKLGRTRLVVLSACESARDGEASRQGVSSIARAFLAAGVPIVVASLWRVDDDVTADLLTAFHVSLTKGAAPAEALRDARLTIKSSPDPRYRSPRSWAGFIVIGGGA